MFSLGNFAQDWHRIHPDKGDILGLSSLGSENGIMKPLHEGGYQDQAKHMALVPVIALKQTLSIFLQNLSTPHQTQEQDTWNPNLDQRAPRPCV